MLLRRDTFGDLFRDMSRLQEFGRLLSRNGFTGDNGMPALAVWGDDHVIHAEVDLPGTDVSKLDVSIAEGNQLTIQGERPALEADQSVSVRQERLAGSFSRTVTLPALVDTSRVTATYQDGVLHLELPKAEVAKPRKIAVKTF